MSILTVALGLTPREAEIVALVATGMSNKAVGRTLEITENTVKVHLKTVFRKLSLGNRTILVAVAVWIMHNSATGTASCDHLCLSTVQEQLSEICSKAVPTLKDALGITEREAQVLALVATGMSNKAVGRKLDIRVATVKSNLRQLCRRLGKNSRTELTILALETVLRESAR